MRLAEAAGVSPGEISVTADEAPDAGGIIRYRVEVPVRRLVAAPSLFGVGSGENSGVYVIEGAAHTRIPEAPAAVSEAGITR
jgi:hypothetical protein